MVEEERFNSWNFDDKLGINDDGLRDFDSRSVIKTRGGGSKYHF